MCQACHVLAARHEELHGLVSIGWELQARERRTNGRGAVLVVPGAGASIEQQRDRQ
jgi:orotidine-5'-phosphate decarboxylase